MRGEEVEVGKLLIVNCINRIHKKMSLAKHKFSEFNKKRKFTNLFTFMCKFHYSAFSTDINVDITYLTH